MLTIAISIHNGLSPGKLPPAWMLKCLYSAQRDTATASTCKWLQNKKKLTNPLPDVGQTRRYFTRLMALFFLLYFLTSSPICLIKETSIQTPIRWYSRSLVHYRLRRPAFRNKSLFLASTPHLQIIGLLCGQQTELGLSNNVDTTVVHLLSLLWNTCWISIWNVCVTFFMHYFLTNVRLFLMFFY